MKVVLCYGDANCKRVSNIVNKMLTIDKDLGIKIELEEQKKLSDYGDELKLLTKRGKE